ncbi:MAG: transcriptional repressor [Pirellulales bacterium]|nr:transcriptional repressor [Pirellulales bacterium]
MSQPKTDELRQTIRKAGLRATPARVATLDLLHGAASPLTHADVAEHLAERGIDKATAYRNLNDMTDVGLLRRTELGDHVWRFEPIAEGEHEHAAHPHFVCVDCGSVSCMDEIKLTAKSLTASKQIGEITEILLRGHCKQCT